MTDQPLRDREDAEDSPQPDDLLEQQHDKGYGEDEGEREQSLDE
jgi:hypothetical protein